MVALATGLHGVLAPDLEQRRRFLPIATTFGVRRRSS
jgi:hypothetical protein